MNTPRGRLAPSALALLTMAVCALAGNAQAQVTCAVSPSTGRLEAALAWRNTLGADRANAMCQSLQASPSKAVDGLPTSRGVAVSPITAVAAPATEVSDGAGTSAQAREVLSKMDARHSGPPSATHPDGASAGARVPVTAVQAVQVSPGPATAAAPAPVGSGFAIAPQDRTFREVIGKWSSMAGWSFAPEHWAVSRDIPVGGADVFTGDFKTAVRTLLKSSLLSDTPARPCFYSNNVLRVIPASELCKRSDL